MAGLCAGLDKVMRVVRELEDQRPIVLFNPRLARCALFPKSCLKAPNKPCRSYCMLGEPACSIYAAQVQAILCAVVSNSMIYSVRAE